MILEKVKKVKDGFMGYVYILDSKTSKQIYSLKSDIVREKREDAYDDARILKIELSYR
jgi:hypothetical protein